MLQHIHYTLVVKLKKDLQTFFTTSKDSAMSLYAPRVNSLKFNAGAVSSHGSDSDSDFYTGTPLSTEDYFSGSPVNIQEGSLKNTSLVLRGAAGLCSTQP